MKSTKRAGLKQAVNIMDALANERDVKTIAILMDSDLQLVRLWTMFLKYNHCIEATEKGGTITNKGLVWKNRLTS